MVARSHSYAALFALLCLVLLPMAADAALVQLSIDRKFPNGVFCPIETRDGLLAEFVAPDNGSVRITFAAENFIEDEFNPGRIYNAPSVDNVMVIPLSQWQASTSSCLDCFNDPDGDGTEGNAPSFPTDGATLSGLPFAETFAAAGSDAQFEGGSWTGDRSAPVDDATGNECFSGGDGSLLLGQESDGDTQVSASVVVDGLTPGESYVVFAWYYFHNTIYCSGGGCWAVMDLIVDETGIVATERSSFGELKASYED